MLMERLKAGASFRDLAAGYSEDPESAPRGGDLGWCRFEAQAGSAGAAGCGVEQGAGRRERGERGRRLHPRAGVPGKPPANATCRRLAFATITETLRRARSSSCGPPISPRCGAMRTWSTTSLAAWSKRREASRTLNTRRRHRSKRAVAADEVSERAAASEPRERSAPAKRRARARVGESEGRSPSAKTRIRLALPRKRCGDMGEYRSVSVEIAEVGAIQISRYMTRPIGIEY